MSKATRRLRSGSSSNGLIEVVDRSTGRKANRAFVAATLIVGVLAAVIASDQIHPILAVLLGAFLGVVAGAIVWLCIYIWPVVRVVWWWFPEITLVSLGLAGWTVLAELTSTLVTGLALAVVVGVPALVGKIRRGLIRLAWCLITRHRIRHCFTTFILTNRFDSDPFILWARPIEAGERVWLLLRPGLSIDNLRNQVKQIAATCWSDEVTIERASDTNSAYLRIDVKRRDPFKRSIHTPLLDGIDATTDTNATTATKRPTPAVEAPTKLDLTDVTTTDVTPIEPTDSETKPNKRPKKSEPRNGDSNGTISGLDGDDVSDWI